MFKSEADVEGNIVESRMCTSLMNCGDNLNKDHILVINYVNINSNKYQYCIV